MHCRNTGTVQVLYLNQDEAMHEGVLSHNTILTLFVVYCLSFNVSEEESF